MKKNRSIYIVWLIIFSFTIFFAYFAIMKHYTFRTTAYDLGIFLNSFYNTLHEGRFFYTTLWEGSRFENHFAPLLFLILPIYAALPRAETLLLLQAFILALGALPLFWIARKEINDQIGIAFALIYLMYPALHGINGYDFHEIALAPTMILFAFHYFKEQRYNISGIFIILSLISREDVAMVIVPMAAIWLWERKEKWSIKDKETIFCITTIFVGLIWFIITTKYIIPYYNPEGYWFVKAYSPEFLVKNLNSKELYILEMFGPLLFIPLFDKLIIITVPIFARNLLSSRTTRFRINNQHQALIIPFMFLSMIYVTKAVFENFKLFGKEQLLKTSIKPVLLICITISFFLSPITTDIIGNAVIPGTLIPGKEAPPYGGPVPITGLFPATPHDKALNQVIDMIPKNASLYAQSNLFPHVADRPKVYYVSGGDQMFKGWNNPQIGLVVPWKNVQDFDYILSDDTDYRWSLLQRTDIESLDIISKNYGLYVAVDKIYLFKKGYNGTVNLVPSLMENFDNKYLPGFYNGIVMNYYNNNNLTGMPVLSDRASNINFRWKKSSPIPGVVNKDNFSIKFEGYVYVPIKDNYLFQLSSNDGSRLYLDEKLIFDGWNTTSASVETDFQSILDKGLHKIRIDYNEKKSSAHIELNWLTPWKGTLEPIPEEYFYIPKENVIDAYNNDNNKNYSNVMNNNSYVTNNNPSLDNYEIKK